jgi:DNA-binding Xre family transcriptional regulator
MSEAKIKITGSDGTHDAFVSVEAKLNRLAVAAEKVKSGLEAIGVAYGIEKAAEYVGTALEQAAALEELRQRTGIATESLSQLQYAAKLNSVSTDTLTGAMKKLQVSMANAIAGDKLKIALFQQLNITQKDLGSGTETVMLKMADAYAHAQDGAGKTAVSIGLMGKAGDEMVPFLNKGSAAIHDMMVEADALGLTISQDLAESANQFETNLTRIHASSQSLAILLAGSLVESLNLAEEAFIRNAKEGNKFLGVLEAYRAFFTGDDLHKANVQLVEDTDKLLKAQNDLDRLKRQGYSDDSIAVQQKTAQIAQLKSEIGTILNYRHELQGETDAKKEAADATKRAREEGKQLEAQSKASLQAAQAEAAEYRAIVKTIDERVDSQKAELAAGRALTEFEKLAIKVAIDLKDAKVKLSAEHLAAVAAKLKEAAATDTLLQQQKQANDFLKQAATEKFKEEDEYNAFLDRQQQERDRVNASIADQARQLDNSNEQLQLEASLIGASDAQRALALEQLRIEQDRKEQIRKLNLEAAIPVVGWIGLAALAAYSIFGGKGGGPEDRKRLRHGRAATRRPVRRHDDGAGPAGRLRCAREGDRRGPDAVEPRLLLRAGPARHRETQLQITAGSYDRAALTGGGPLGENVGRGANDLTNAVALADAQAELKNLQEKATGQIGDFLKTVNVTTASLGDMQKALDVATDVGALNHALAGLSDTFSELSGFRCRARKPSRSSSAACRTSCRHGGFNDKLLTSRKSSRCSSSSSMPRSSRPASRCRPASRPTSKPCSMPRRTSAATPATRRSPR